MRGMTHRRFRNGPYGHRARIGAALAAAALVVVATAMPGLAQTLELAIPGAEDVAIHDTGWGQFRDREELVLFALDVLLTLGITAAIAYHPCLRTERRSVADFRLPRTLFVYGLIGMTVGFLVVHHGYLIGFVIFGIGGLLRFRSSGETPLETMQMILVTVMGLCVGLEVPAMAIIITGLAWGVFYVLGSTEYHSVEIKLADDKRNERGRAAVRALIEETGATVVTERKARFKSSVEFIVSVQRAAGTGRIEAALAERQAQKGGEIADWHIA